MSARVNPGQCDVGPIRPPSEAFSLLLRVTRNCPWNGCLFCPVYKGTRFEKRGEEAVMAEIDLLADAADKVRARAGVDTGASGLSDRVFMEIAHDHLCSYDVRRMALWMHRGGRHVFLQDADSLVIPVHRMARILRHLRARFPAVDRVTTYARSRTLFAKPLEQLAELKEAGLTRIHVGLESGSDEVLALVKKGCRAEHHVVGIGKVKAARFEVCCYVMPGLGGKALSARHAEETAAVLRTIDPDYVRLRTMFITEGIPLYEKVRTGEMTLLEEDEVVAEIRTLLRGLGGANCAVVSDHDHNLLMEIQGHVTREAASLDAALSRFLDLPQAVRESFIAARRSGFFRYLSSFLADPDHATQYLPVVRELKRAGDGSLIRGMLATLSWRLF